MVWVRRYGDSMAISGKTRSTDRTRRAILDAASELMGKHGTSVYLARIAEAAGVSKGGLLHHFPSRNDLIRALGEDCARQLRSEVEGFLDLSENRPGKMLRAYVRALCGGSGEAMVYFADSSTWYPMIDIPEVKQAIADNVRWWDEQFAADGLPDDRIRLVRRAAEGCAAAYVWGEETEEGVAQLRGLLLGLTEESAPLT